MNIVKLFICFLFLSGCMSSGWKSPTAKSLQGSVKNSIYQAADGSFEIQTPVLQNQKGWPLLQISEQYHERVNTVVFTVSSNYYHMGDSYGVLIDRTQNTAENNLSLDEVVQSLVDKYSKPISKIRIGMNELQRFDMKINNQAAVMLVMKEEIAESGVFAKNILSGKTLYHIMAIQASDKGFANVWIQLMNGCIACESGSKTDILNTNNKIRDFIQSFKLKI